MYQWRKRLLRRPTSTDEAGAVNAGGVMESLARVVRGIRGNWPTKRAAATLLVMMACLATESLGQTTSTIEGVVTDQQGLAVAGAEVRAEEHGLAVDRTAKSLSDGSYKIVGLPAGIYSVTVSSSGFVQQTVRSLELTVNRSVTLNFALKLGGQTE